VEEKRGSARLCNLTTLLITLLSRGAKNNPSIASTVAPYWKHMLKLLARLAHTESTADDDMMALTREQVRRGVAKTDGAYSRLHSRLGSDYSDFTSSDADYSGIVGEIARNILVMCEEKLKQAKESGNGFLDTSYALFGPQVTPQGASYEGDKECQLHVLITLMQSNYKVMTEEMDFLQEKSARAGRAARDDPMNDPSLGTSLGTVSVVVKSVKNHHDHTKTAQSHLRIGLALFVVEHALHLLEEHVAMHLDALPEGPRREEYLESCQVIKQRLGDMVMFTDTTLSSRGHGDKKEYSLVQATLRPQRGGPTLQSRFEEYVKLLGDYPENYGKDRFSFLEYRVRKFQQMLEVDVPKRSRTATGRVQMQF